MSKLKYVRHIVWQIPNNSFSETLISGLKDWQSDEDVCISHSLRLLLLWKPEILIFCA